MFVPLKYKVHLNMLKHCGKMVISCRSYSIHIKQEEIGLKEIIHYLSHIDCAQH